LVISALDLFRISDFVLRICLISDTIALFNLDLQPCAIMRITGRAYGQDSHT
jgi:hypothetical protein